MAFFKGREIELRLAGGPGGTYTAGDNIDITDGVISVETTDEAKETDGRPITSRGVYTIVGNIEILLKTI